MISNTIDCCWNRNLIVVEGFAYPCGPGSCTVGSMVLLVGTPMVERSQARGQTKSGSEDPYEESYM